MTLMHTVTYAPNEHANGYPWQARCECGWRSIGYAAAHAAKIMMDNHLETEH
jgi:hypothetical protein